MSTRDGRDDASQDPWPTPPGESSSRGPSSSPGSASPGSGTNWSRSWPAPPASGSLPATNGPVVSMVDVGRLKTVYPLPLPDDPGERQRLGDQHWIVRNLFHRLSWIPPLQPQGTGDMSSSAELRMSTSSPHAAFLGWRPHRILDVGCGTGVWMREIAQAVRKQYSGLADLTVVGFDLVLPVLPDRVLEPLQDARGATYYRDPKAPDCQYTTANVLQPLPFGTAFEEQFDYVHVNGLGAGIPAPAWGDVLQQLIRLLRPGGFIEIIDLGMPKMADPSLAPATMELLRLVQLVFMHHEVDLDQCAMVQMLLSMEPELQRWCWTTARALPFHFANLDRDSTNVATCAVRWLAAVARRLDTLGLYPVAELQRLIEDVKRELTYPAVGLNPPTWPMFISCARRDDNLPW